MGQLVEIGKKQLGEEVSCLDIAPIPYGRQRSRFLGFFFLLFSSCISHYSALIFFRFFHLLFVLLLPMSSISS